MPSRRKPTTKHPAPFKPLGWWRRLDWWQQALATFLVVVIVLGLPMSGGDNPYAHLFYRGHTRVYWIAVVPQTWNIVPSGEDGISGDRYQVQNTTIEALIYRQYSANWKHVLPDEYGGQPGPMIRATVGDTIIVHFKNLDTYYKRPHSMHPHGVSYTPANDGSYVYANQQPGSAIAVGSTYTYTWKAASNSAGDWVYHDHSVDAVDNTVLGMYGLIEISQPGTRKPDTQMVTFFDEMTTDVTGLPMEYDTLNGRAFVGNTPTYQAKVGDHVQWIVAALGSEFHIFHIHGHRWTYNGQNTDTLELGPSEAKSVSFTEDSVGTWLVHCHVDEHMMNGMSALYQVSAKNGTQPSVNEPTTAPPAHATQPMNMPDMD